MQDLHDAEFKKTDCLKCANCCKTTGPLFTSADIERVSKHLRQKPQQFIDHYLRSDAKGLFTIISSWIEQAEDNVITELNTQLSEDQFKTFDDDAFHPSYEV